MLDWMPRAPEIIRFAAIFVVLGLSLCGRRKSVDGKVTMKMRSCIHSSISLFGVPILLSKVNKKICCTCKLEVTAGESYDQNTVCV